MTQEQNANEQYLLPKPFQPLEKALGKYLIMPAVYLFGCYLLSSGVNIIANLFGFAPYTLFGIEHELHVRIGVTLLLFLLAIWPYKERLGN